MELEYPKFLRIAILSPNMSTPSISMMKYLHVLCQALGTAYEIVHPADNEYGRKLKNGTWTGVVGLVHREECDLAVETLAPSAQRSEAVNFSFPYDFTDTTFVTYKPRLSRDRYALVEPFTMDVHLAILVTVICLTIVLKNISRWRTTSYTTAFLRIFGCLFEPVALEKNRKSVKVLLFSWIAGAMFLGNFYRGVLLACLTLPSTSGIGTVAELAKAVSGGYFECRTLSGSFVIHSLMNSEQAEIRTIGNALDKYSVIPMNAGEYMDIDDENKAYVSSRRILGHMADKYFISQDKFFNIIYAFPYSKSFCCRRALDLAIMRISEAGLYEFIWKQSRMLYNIKNTKQEKPHNRALTVEDLWAIFIVVVLGNTLGAVAFVGELISKSIEKNKEVSDTKLTRNEYKTGAKLNSRKIKIQPKKKLSVKQKLKLDNSMWDTPFLEYTSKDYSVQCS